MNLTLRPYQPSDAAVITSWLKSEYLMRQWCADRYERYPVTPEDMNTYHERNIDGQHSRALTMTDGDDIVGYITLRTPADNPTEQRLGFVIVDDSKRGRGLGKALVSMAVKYLLNRLAPQKCHSESLKIIRPLSIAMKPPVFIEYHYLKPRVTNVWAKRGIASRWSSTNYYEKWIGIRYIPVPMTH